MISPEAFGSGLAKGSSSLVKSTIGGVMAAASAVTSSASKALATASGDSQFVAAQAAARGQKQPEHLGAGLKMGVQALGTSLFSGVTGVILDPLAGARREGLAGFGKVRRGSTGCAATMWSAILSISFPSAHFYLLALVCLYALVRVWPRELLALCSSLLPVFLISLLTP